MNALTPHHALVSLLRNAADGVPLVSWGESASPFYEEVPEPPPAFPYVMFEMPDSELVHTFEGGYAEIFKPVVNVYARQDNIYQVSDPGIPGSVFNYLDSFSDNNGAALNGMYFTCGGWWRLSYKLGLAPPRDPDGIRRIYVATAAYEMTVNRPYPILGR